MTDTAVPGKPGTAVDLRWPGVRKAVMALTTDTTIMKSPAESAAAGAQWLDEHYVVKYDIPWFWAIDLTMFDMNHGRYCVIGQLYGPYIDVVVEVVRQIDPSLPTEGNGVHYHTLMVAARSVAVAYGWMWPEIVTDGYWDYHATESWKTDLNNAWRTEIERRRS